MSDARQHWEAIYRGKAPHEVGWFQARATVSLRLIQSQADLSARIIDVGGGASVLVDELLDAGYRELTVLDLAESALAASQSRLGQRADAVHWMVGNVLDVALPPCGYDVWHDRAVFHFLTEPLDRARYVAQVRRSVRPGGRVIVATFGPQGPTQCAGLDVVRYSPQALQAEFGAGFELLEAETEVHRTPSGGEQEYVFCCCRRL